MLSSPPILPGEGIFVDQRSPMVGHEPRFLYYGRPLRLRGQAMRISLCGAAREVTGSGYLVETATARVLVDFGMFQGSRRNGGTQPGPLPGRSALPRCHRRHPCASRSHGATAASAVARLSRSDPRDARDGRLRPAHPRRLGPAAASGRRQAVPQAASRREGADRPALWATGGRGPGPSLLGVAL